MPELTKNKEDPDDGISPVAAKIMKIATKMLENALGIGELKVTGKVVEIMYHVYHLVEYLDNEKSEADYYHAAWEVGAIVKDLESIIDQLTDGGILLSIEDLEQRLDAIEERLDKLPKSKPASPAQSRRRLEGGEVNVKHHDLTNVFNENSFEIFANAYYSQMRPEGGNDIDFSECVQHKDQTKELYEILGKAY